MISLKMKRATFLCVVASQVHLILILTLHLKSGGGVVEGGEARKPEHPRRSRVKFRLFLSRF